MNLTISPHCLELSSALELTLFVMKCHFVKKVGKNIFGYVKNSLCDTGKLVIVVMLERLC